MGEEGIGDSIACTRGFPCSRSSLFRPSVLGNGAHGLPVRGSDERSYSLDEGSGEGAIEAPGHVRGGGDGASHV